MRPATNRDGLWVIYERRTQRVMELPEAEARPLLDRGTHVVAPGARPGDWDSDSNVGPVWPLKVSPEAYLKRRGDDAKNSALARQVLGIAEPEADGESGGEG